MGMNAEAFRHIIFGVIGFIERVGITVGEAIKFLKSEPPLDENGMYALPSSVTNKTTLNTRLCLIQEIM
jgi:hypothetical protein